MSEKKILELRGGESKAMVLDEAGIVSKKDYENLGKKPKMKSIPDNAMIEELMTKEEVKKKLEEHVGKKLTDDEATEIAKKMINKTVAYPKIPLEFQEMRGMLFHLFTKTIATKGRMNKGRGMSYKGVSMTMRLEVKGDVSTKVYQYNSKKANLSFEIKEDGAYTFNFLKGNERQLRRLMNRSFIDDFNKMVEEETEKAKERERVMKEVKDKKEKENGENTSKTVSMKDVKAGDTNIKETKKSSKNPAKTKKQKKSEQD